VYACGTDVDREAQEFVPALRISVMSLLRHGREAAALGKSLP